jgi:hypothetical protein
VNKTTLDLSKNMRAVVLLNLATLPVAALAITLLLGFTSLVRTGENLSLQVGGLWSVVGAIGLYVLMILTHEAVHGVFFWWYTRAMPVFGVSWTYAYAAAPRWYILRSQYLVVALAPFVAITVVGLLLIALGPPKMIIPVSFVIVANAAGCVGDFAVVWWLMRQDRRALVQDVGDAMTIYTYLYA